MLFFLEDFYAFNDLLLESLLNCNMTEFLIILINLNKLNSKISMYKDGSRFLLKKYKSFFPFAENAPYN